MEASFFVYRNKVKLLPKALNSPVDGHVSASASSKIAVASKKVKECMEVSVSQYGAKRGFLKIAKAKIFNIGYAIL